MMRSKYFQDWVNLVLAILLFIAPWALGFSADRTASSNAWVSGIVVAVLAIAALTAFAEWEEWLEMLVGAWVVISPWALAFNANPLATWTHVILGLLVIIFAGSELYQFKRAPVMPRSTPTMMP